MNGKVYLVGAGPGDPELLTLKALRVLQGADVVLWDRLVDERILAFTNPAADRIAVGKRPGDSPDRQQRIFELMMAEAQAGNIVVRLKGGDPMVFGRGGEEWRYLAERGIEVELVPGVSSAVAVPGLAGIPLTLRGVSSSFAVVTGRRSGPEADWRRYAGVDTLVILMGVEQRTEIAGGLIAAGRSPAEPVAFIERGATPQERVVVATLAQVAAGSVLVEAPAVLVVGEIVRLRSHLTDHQPTLAQRVPALTGGR
ncbi:MAG: uroporphyrinogen-III C-methyltransferase [Acidimicrobiia bacterium]